MFDRLWMLDSGDALSTTAIPWTRSSTSEAPPTARANRSTPAPAAETSTRNSSSRSSKRRPSTNGDSPQNNEESPPKSAPSSSEKHTPVRKALAVHNGTRRKQTRSPPLREQFSVFFLRTMKSRLANKSYRVSALLQPLLLALAAGLLFRGSWGSEYVLRNNNNLPGYFFISTVIAVFLGMALSADEINRDRMILERERLLRLSRGAYLASKCAWLLLAAALQTGVYTLLGNSLLHIPSSGFAAWAILSARRTARHDRLILSDTLTSSSAIHILIPVLLAPQIMLGGPTISFDELLRKDAGNRNVPLIAEIMPTRWGYEALMVEHYSNNPFHKAFFHDETREKWIDFLTGVYIPEVRGLASYPFSPTLNIAGISEDADKARQRLKILRNELDYLERFNGTAMAGRGTERRRSRLGEVHSRGPTEGDGSAQRGGSISQTTPRRDSATPDSDRRRATRKRSDTRGSKSSRTGVSTERSKNSSIGITAEDAIVISGQRLVPKVLPIAMEAGIAPRQGASLRPVQAHRKFEVHTAAFQYRRSLAPLRASGHGSADAPRPRAAALFRRFHGL